MALLTAPGTAHAYLRSGVGEHDPAGGDRRRRGGGRGVQGLLGPHRRVSRHRAHRRIRVGVVRTGVASESLRAGTPRPEPETRAEPSSFRDPAGQVIEGPDGRVFRTVAPGTVEEYRPCSELRRRRGADRRGSAGRGRRGRSGRSGRRAAGGRAWSWSIRGFRSSPTRTSGPSRCSRPPALLHLEIADPAARPGDIVLRRERLQRPVQGRQAGLHRLALSLASLSEKASTGRVTTSSASSS